MKKPPEEIIPGASFMDHVAGNSIRARELYEKLDRWLVYAIGILVLCRFFAQHGRHLREGFIEVVAKPLEWAEWLTVLILLCGIAEFIGRLRIGSRISVKNIDDL
jgi:hypothetical protein